MASPISDRFQTLAFSYAEMASMGFNYQFTEDYLNQIRNLLIVSSEVDIDKDNIESNTLRLDAVEPVVESNTLRLDTVEPVVENNVLRLNAVEPIAAANAAAIALASGQLVGNNDFATSLVGGVVNLMALVSDAVDSNANIAMVDVGVAPAVYDQAYTQSVTDLLNDTKSKHNQLVTDVNAVITQLNELISNSITAKQMSAT